MALGQSYSFGGICYPRKNTGYNILQSTSMGYNTPNESSIISPSGTNHDYVVESSCETNFGNYKEGPPMSLGVILKRENYILIAADKRNTRVRQDEDGTPIYDYQDNYDKIVPIPEFHGLLLSTGLNTFDGENLTMLVNSVVKNSTKRRFIYDLKDEIRKYTADKKVLLYYIVEEEGQHYIYFTYVENKMDGQVSIFDKKNIFYSCGENYAVRLVEKLYSPNQGYDEDIKIFQELFWHIAWMEKRLDIPNVISEIYDLYKLENGRIEKIV